MRGVRADLTTGDVLVLTVKAQDAEAAAAQWAWRPVRQPDGSHRAAAAARLACARSAG